MIPKHKTSYYSGTSNVVLPVANKLSFPAEYQSKSRLCYYGSLFNSVEVNSTFYKLPLTKTISRWVTEVPHNFKFTFKIWQQITHNKGLAFNAEDVKRFMFVVNSANNKQGSLLLQLPPSTTVNTYQLNHLINEIKQAGETNDWQIAVEFRHKSWYNDAILELLDEHKIAMVIHDLPASAAPLHTGNANFVYLRFHGPQGGYRGSYSNEFLYEYAQYIKEWIEDNKTVYTYFNNTMGEAVKNLITLNGYVNND